MTTLLAAAVIAYTAFAPVAAPGADPGKDRTATAARVWRVQSNLSWSGSWIWTPENRKWVDRDNQASITLLEGRNVEYCIYASCWTAQYDQKEEIYSFSVRSGSSSSYYEFWLGDFGSLEGRFWLDVKTRRGAPDAMVRMKAD